MTMLEINWGTGYMELYLDTFFPAPISKAIKVFKLINQYCTDEQIESLDEYLVKAKAKSFEEKQTYIKEYRRWHQKAAELQEIIDSGKLPMGLRVSKQELKEYKNNLKDAKKRERTYLKAVKEQKRKLEGVDRNIELLHTHTHTHIKGGDS